MSRDKTTLEAALEVAARIEEAGLDSNDPILKTGRVTLNCTAGTVSDVKERPDSIVFKVLVTHMISYSKEIEVIVGDDDKVTYKEV